MRLRIHGDKAHARMLGLQDSRFQDGLLHYWTVRPDGSVAANSLLWLFCWAETGMRSVAAMEDCRRFWNDFTGVPFFTLDSSDFHAFARDGRYKTRLSDASLLTEMQRVADRDLSFLADGSSDPFPSLPSAPVSPSAKVRQPAAPPPALAPRPAPARAKAHAAPAPLPVPATPARPSPSELDRLHAICRATDNRIWQTHQASLRTAAPPASGLVFPSYTSRAGLRISEQEARVLFCQQAEASGRFAYSVETPTERRYDGRTEAFVAQGEAGMSARLDVTLYRGDRTRALNVEFKAGGAGTSLGESAASDLIKLLAEPVDGMWFGILETSSEPALKSILATFWRTVEKHASSAAVSANLPMFLLFHICVLQPAFSLHRVALVPDPKAQRLMSAQDFAAFRWPGAAPAVDRETETPGGWTLRQPAAA